MVKHIYNVSIEEAFIIGTNFICSVIYFNIYKSIFRFVCGLKKETINLKLI